MRYAVPLHKRVDKIPALRNLEESEFSFDFGDICGRRSEHAFDDCRSFLMLGGEFPNASYYLRWRNTQPSSRTRIKDGGALAADVDWLFGL